MRAISVEVANSIKDCQEKRQRSIVLCEFGLQHYTAAAMIFNLPDKRVLVVGSKISERVMVDLLPETHNVTFVQYLQLSRFMGQLPDYGNFDVIIFLDSENYLRDPTCELGITASLFADNTPSVYMMTSLRYNIENPQAYFNMLRCVGIPMVSSFGEFIDVFCQVTPLVGITGCKDRTIFHRLLLDNTISVTPGDDGGIYARTWESI